jgi:hypothetical protein
MHINFSAASAGIHFNNLPLVKIRALISNPKPFLSKAEDLKFEPQSF